MEQGSFEDIVKKKFDGQGKQVSSSVWENINSSLDADLVAHYQASRAWHRWIAAAAILIAVSSFAIQYVSLSKDKAAEKVYYNALLSENSYSAFERFQTQLEPVNFNPIYPIFLGEKEKSPSVFVRDEELKNYQLDELIIKPKKPSMELAEANIPLQLYYRILGNSPGRINDSKNEFWAGLEAGAGKFSPNFSGANSISNSVNSAAAATAIGADNFVNPSVSAIQNEMNEGISTSFGFDFGMKLGKKWTLESGLAYTNINNTGSASLNVFDVFDTQTGISDNKPDLEDTDAKKIEGGRLAEASIDGDVELNNNMQFASLPLKAGYFLLNERFSLRLNAGVSANYLIENSLSDPSRQIINSSQSSLYNDWSFDGIGGLEFGYRLFDKIDMTIEPNYRYSITPLSNNINSPSRFVVQTGFRYTLR